MRHFRQLSSSCLAAAFSRNTDPNAVFVVTGASRGLGLEFTTQLLARTKGRVVACCRAPPTEASSHRLNELLAQEAYASRLSVLPLDLASQTSIDDFPAILTTAIDTDRVDMLLNVAGILHSPDFPKAPERAVKDIEREWLMKTLEVNAVAPLMLTKALEPFLKQPRKKVKKGEESDPEGRPPAVVASVSARVGSISDNGLGGWYSYRLSKAALNMATVNLSLELKRSGVWVIALHPGTTDTDLSKPFQKNVKPEKLFTPEFSVSSMLDVVDGLDESKTGSFFAYDGQEVPW
mmetsp:Transcript_28320/g.58000  ORF Transcript_28320/g.58000 Transcript_28320/m.58000 type:complete len:292 (+) Transcript_28320:97-972(+)